MRPEGCPSIVSTGVGLGWAWLPGAEKLEKEDNTDNVFILICFPGVGEGTFKL